MANETTIVPRWLTRSFPALAVVVGGWVIGLGVVVHGSRLPLRLDRAVDNRLVVRHGWENWAAHRLADLGDPIPFTMVVVVLLVVCAAWAGRRAALGAGLAVGGVAAVIEYVAKPVFDRHMFGSSGYSYPSGHTGASLAAATVTVLLCTRSPALRRRLRVPTRCVIAVVAVILAASISLGMVVIGAHYFTDTLGAAPLAVVLAVAVFAATERWAPVSRRRGKGAAEPMPGPSHADPAPSTPESRVP